MTRRRGPLGWGAACALALLLFPAPSAGLPFGEGESPLDGGLAPAPRVLAHRLEAAPPAGPAVDRSAAATGPAPMARTTEPSLLPSAVAARAKREELVEPLLAKATLEEILRAVARRRGAPLLLNFWAIWCHPCVEELPDLAAIEERFASSRVRVLGVSADLLVEDDSRRLRKTLRKTLRRAGVRYPNLIYAGRADPLHEAFDLPGPIPHSILFDSSGREIKRWTGPLSLVDLKQALDGL